MTKQQDLEAARNMEADCTLGAGSGFGRYTREIAERIRSKRSQISPRVLVDSDPTTGSVRKLLDQG